MRALDTQTTIAHLVLVPAVLLTLAGCSRGPRPIPMPRVDASAAGQGALQKYDTSGDGVIRDAELDAAVALRSALKLLDTNGDQGVSADEVAARATAWRKSQIPIAPVAITLTYQGKPLEGATIQLIPEDYLGSDLRQAGGITDEFGIAHVSIPPENRPTSDAPSGVQFGLYRIEVSKQEGGKESLPARYNTETTLGLEVSYDNPRIINPPLTIDLP